MSKPTKELIDGIYRSRILQARKTPPGQRLADCLELFESSCSIMKDGLRAENPLANEQQIEVLLRERLAIARRLDEYGIYRPVKEKSA